MKKILSVVFLVVVMAAIVFGCVCAFKHFTREDELGKVTNIGESEAVANKALFTKDDYPRVDASTAIQPLAEAIKKDFVGEESSKIETEYLDTHYGFLGVVDGTRDVCFMSYPSQEEMNYAKEKNVELEIIRATNSAFCFIVNSNNPVDSLTLDQIRGIYTGRITNWKEVGGDDLEIIPYQRPVNSGSQSGMIQLVMNGEELMTPPSITLSLEMGQMIDAVAEFKNGPAAIGYSYYYYLNTMYKRDTIKILKINDIPATKETIKANEYPIMTSGWYVIRKDEPQDGMTRKWIEAMESSRGAKVIEDMGYIPAK